MVQFEELRLSLLDYEEKLGLLTIRRKVSALRDEIKDENLIKKLDDIFGDL